MLILDLWGISFHPVVVVGLGNDLLFNFIVGHCAGLRHRALGHHVIIWNLLISFKLTITRNNLSNLSYLSCICEFFYFLEHF